jgi:uncharacterized membrane protein
MTIKTTLRWLLAVFMVGSGLNHFRAPEVYLAMMPAELPVSWHAALNVLSGAAEIAGGLGLIVPRTRRWAAWGLVLLLVAVFPANVNMAVHGLPLGDTAVPSWALWARLPLQGLFVAWAWWFTRPDREHAGGRAVGRTETTR